MFQLSSGLDFSPVVPGTQNSGIKLRVRGVVQPRVREVQLPVIRLVIKDIDRRL